MQQIIPDWHRRGDYIPHCENKSFQTITFRLFDSLPPSVLEEVRREQWILQGSPNDGSKFAKLAGLRMLMNHYEDAGYGSCFLKDSRIALIVADALRYFDGERYRLIAYCIMPNHVHVLIEVATGWSLLEILHSWRSFSAKKANRVLGRSGQFWMKEYYDRFIRNDEHFANALAYIRMNPVKAGLVSKCEDWPWTWEMPNKEIFWRNGYLGPSLE